MSRLAGILVLVLALFQGSGLEACVGEMACAAEHHDSEGSESDCPPECAACPCCARAMFTPVGGGDLVPAPRSLSMGYFEGAASLVPAPPPQGILHVPRSMA